MAETLLDIVADVFQQVTAAATPPVEVIAANRMGYGPRPGDLDRIRTMGLDAYITEQLNPNDADDALLAAKLSAARLKIRYDAGTGYPDRSDAPGLNLINLDRPTDTGGTAWTLWQRGSYDDKYPMNYSERQRPFDEIRVAQWFRAVYSKWQLREVMVEFWHNHFNVNGSGESEVSATLPNYDRIMRRNCFGNFQNFLIDVAKSTAMQYYLDNYNNEAGGGEGGNENYARELFELHTFSTDNYYKFYDDTTQVPWAQYNGQDYLIGGAKVKAGYVDQDVYEAAACLSGWSIADGTWKRNPKDPNNGEFFYDPNWHYYGTKEVLGITIRSQNQPSDNLKDGLKVFELLARHPNVAKNICLKIARRLISDTPPDAVVLAARDVWMANLDAPDQLKKVIESILRSDAFKTTWGQKMKRPFEFMVSFFRATESELPIDAENVGGDKSKGGYWGSFFWQYGQAGHKIFEWPTPTGFPDRMVYWSNTNGMLKRWNLVSDLGESWGGNVTIPIVAKTNLGSSCNAIVDFWIGRLFGYEIDAAVRNRLVTFLAYGGDPAQPPKPTQREPDWNNTDRVKERIEAMVQLLSAAPAYHLR